jgi:hypothetical protein
MDGHVRRSGILVIGIPSTGYTMGCGRTLTFIHPWPEEKRH